MQADPFSSLASNLQRKGYSQIAGPSANAVTMFKAAAGLGVPKIVCIVSNTDPPAQTFARYESWIERTMGRSGAGLLLLVRGNPTQNDVNDAVAQGRGALGYGQVVCGIFDAARNAYWLPKGAFDTYHMGWDQEVFG